jgi:serine O-acetyltransferase
VDIGADAIIGAGAAVVGAIPAGATAVGVPARVIRLAGGAATQKPQTASPPLNQA